MSLFGGHLPAPNEIQGIQISSSVNALPTPIVFGSPRCGANLIWLNGFTASPAPSSGGVGKGGKSISAYVYNAWILLAICEGQVGEPYLKYIDGVAFGFDFSYFTPNQTISNLSFQDGNYAITPVPAIIDEFPAQALAYRGVANVFGENYRIDPSATVPQFNFVLPGFFTGTCPLNDTTITIFVSNPPFANITIHPGCMDADPAQCINALLTNPIWGAGFPENLIDPSIFTTTNGTNPTVGDNSYSTYCQCIGVGFSVCLDSSESAASIISRWCELTNTAPVWTGTTLKFIPYGDQVININPGYVEGNPGGIPRKYFTPQVVPLFSLTDDDFEQSTQLTEDPVTIDRKDIADIYNCVRLSWPDRNNAWNRNVTEAKDENHIELYGIRVDNLAEAKEFTHDGYAQISAQLRVQRNVSIDRTFRFRLSWAFCVLEPMDVIEITDVNIGLIRQTVRIISIEENDRGILEIVAEIFPIGAGNALAYPTQSLSPSTVFYPGAPASPVEIPFIFEPTTQMLQAQSLTNPAIIIGVCGGVAGVADPNWAGALIYLSLEMGGDYSFVGQSQIVSRMGILESAFSSYSGGNPDVSNTLQVNMNQSGQNLDSVANTQAATALPQTSLCGIINQHGALELLSYETATLVSPGIYNLTTLYRGLYGTVAAEADAGSQFLRIDPGTFEYNLPPQFVGQTLYAKLLSVNIAGLVTETLADATVYQYTPGGNGFAYFDVSGLLNGMPGGSQVIFNYVFSNTVTFPIGLVGSQGSAHIGATASTTFNINKNGTLIGTMVFSSGGSSPEAAIFTMLSATSFALGDILTIIAPASPDATLSDLTWTLLGQTF